jgi:hypothetical protein
MLLKLAETREEQPTICFENLRFVAFNSNQQDIYFDLRHDYRAESLPNEIANILRWTKVAERKQLGMLPKFSSFVKYGPEVRIRVSNRPILLRDIIDNRHIMEANG